MENILCVFWVFLASLGIRLCWNVGRSHRRKDLHLRNWSKSSMLFWCHYQIKLIQHVNWRRYKWVYSLLSLPIWWSRTARVRQKLFEAEFQSESRLSARQELPALTPVGLYVSPSLNQFNNLSPVRNFFRTDIVETGTTGFFFFPAHVSFINGKWTHSDFWSQWDYNLYK